MFVLARLAPVLAVAAVLAAPTGCAKKLERQLVAPGDAAHLDRDSRFLKAHMKNGDVIVFGRWQVNELRREVSGPARRYDVDREPMTARLTTIRIDDVAIFETNVARNSRSVAGMAIVTGISTAVTVACLANPKACFGSCPTFYLDDGQRPVLMAEGFSDSIAPSLEADDLDALPAARPHDGRLVVTMTNEALETHVVRHVDVLAAPRAPGERVFATPSGVLRRAPALATLVGCHDSAGAPCQPALRGLDGDERVSQTDGVDLASRETIDLEFPALAPGDLAPRGLVLASRQTLLSTYVLYQALAWVGGDIGAVLAALERRSDAAGAGASKRGPGPDASDVHALLGFIEVQVPDGAGGFRTVGQLGETGPLATDVKLLELPAGAGQQVRLRIARGHFRLDWAALATLGDAVTPVRVRPSRVVGQTPDARRGLVTLPGDRVRFEYQLPPGDHELFLHTRGYYLEWMRDEWLREHAPLKAARLLLSPAAALRELAPAFKRVEPEMERLFWASRFRRRDSARLPSGSGVPAAAPTLSTPGVRP
ncbi:MAG: hypothetical protein IT370_19835 [Deltaproteobacteria bacterium]|nr:hypothetical protein [Deltaproteobacteria bacterium]